ncbi:DUF6174 domain-containing protein [Streptomyces sp. NPDC004542]|uniref:DUF6174 domain-containing protein n=1 Tax=Streptomyces sp. NPDC004542 TaxID=3154281 RepID=UPI0033A5FCEB
MTDTEGVTMNRLRCRARLATPAAFLGALLYTTAGCGSSECGGPTGGNEPESTWEEPAAYSYTLTSSTQVLAGTFRVKVRDGRAVEVVGLDEDSRRQARDMSAQVPTLGDLLKSLQQARSEHADTAEADYAADGHPVRISLDQDKNAIDDEALYTISSYAQECDGSTARRALSRCPQEPPPAPARLR